jgi:hypothetical protein
VEYELQRKFKIEEKLQSRLENIKSYDKFSVNKHKTKTFEIMSIREEMQKEILEEKKNEKYTLARNKKLYGKNV